jgi:adenosine deaminase
MTPLVDLHRHLEGSIRPETCIELATRAGSGLLPAQWRAALVAAEREEGLLPYLAKIENATALVRTLDDWRRVATEAIADACSDGLAALELRFSPQFIAGMTALDPDDIIETVSDAVSSTGLPIEVGLIGIIVRDEGPDSALVQVRRLLRHRDALVGVDLAGNEAGYPAELFTPAFRLAHESGFPVTIHAGEAAGPHSVWDALRLAPHRIGHGVRSAEDPRLLEHLAARGVTLEVAITSNVQTRTALQLRAAPARDPGRRRRPHRAVHRQPGRERHPLDPRVRACPGSGGRGVPGPHPAERPSGALHQSSFSSRRLISQG